MEVTVRLLSGMRKYLPEPKSGQTSCEINLKSGSTVASVLARLGIPADKRVTVLVNRLFSDSSCVLQDGDVLSVFDPVAGG